MSADAWILTGYVGFIVLLFVYLGVVNIKIRVWARKNAEYLNLVHVASSEDIRNRLPWDWRYDYFNAHGSIWAYAWVPWRRYASTFPDNAFITKGASRALIEST